MAVWRSEQNHKHSYKLLGVVQRSPKAIRQLRFKCEGCDTYFETTRRAIWYPTKLIPLTERTIEYLVDRTKFSKEELLDLLKEQRALGSTSVWINIERQLDGTWTNVPLNQGE